MDTDGSVCANGGAEFSTVSDRLAHDVAFLVQSLGGKVTIQQRQTKYTYSGELREGLISYRVRIRLNVCPFRLVRKASRWKPTIYAGNRFLYSIEPAGADECICIEVDHPSRTYVTAHGIVTHNTVAGAYEVTLHALGKYPDWWQGRRFAHPTRIWVCGDTSITVRDILQLELLGPPGNHGTGMIPQRAIERVTLKRNVPDGAQDIFIRRPDGGRSVIGLRSYDQGREAFQGTAQDAIWLDEECDLPIYTECLLRTMTTNGLVLCTFTPLKGLSDVVQLYMPGGVIPPEQVPIAA